MAQKHHREEDGCALRHCIPLAATQSLQSRTSLRSGDWGGSWCSPSPDSSLQAGFFRGRLFLPCFCSAGLTEVAFQMALQRGMVSPRLPFGRVLRYSGLMAIGFILVMYITLRIVNLTH